MSRAVAKYREFHQLSPRRIGEFRDDFIIPRTAVLAGPAHHVMYRSDKLNPSTGEDEGVLDYIHDHDSGVHVYRTDADCVGEVCAVPPWLQRAQSLVLLGQCLGFEYLSPDGIVTAVVEPPLPELYTITSGRALLVIQNKRSIKAIMWGGKLGVEARGIVG